MILSLYIFINTRRNYLKCRIIKIDQIGKFSEENNLFFFLTFIPLSV